MSRARQRADRIREEIDITQVLADYGYPVHAGYGGEEQFSCDLHGDGTDNKPSARVYPESNSFYCFACDRTRDAIQLVREKEGLGFWDAVKALEKRYGLGRMEYDEEVEYRKDPAKGFADEMGERISGPPETWEDEAKRTKTRLDGFTLGKDIPLGALLKFWENYDKVCYLVEKELLHQDVGKAALIRIREEALEKMKGSV